MAASQKKKKNRRKKLFLEKEDGKLYQNLTETRIVTSQNNLSLSDLLNINMVGQSRGQFYNFPQFMEKHHYCSQFHRYRYQSTKGEKMTVLSLEKRKTKVSNFSLTLFAKVE